ncbi:MAG: response regulator [Anaerolineae bacterium]|nr:response regulator [Anaerolineae bacterium]
MTLNAGNSVGDLARPGKRWTDMDELRGKRIFIVEDDVVNMAVFAVTLRQTGATIIQDAWNANTINILVQNLPIDVILLDLMLRFKTSGYDIFDKIQADPKLKEIPIIAVSASDPEIEIPKAKDKGFAGFIGKPIEVYKFPIQIAACMKGEKVWYAQT